MVSAVFTFSLRVCSAKGYGTDRVQRGTGGANGEKVVDVSCSGIQRLAEERREGNGESIGDPRVRIVVA